MGILESDSFAVIIPNILTLQIDYFTYVIKHIIHKNNQPPYKSIYKILYVKSHMCFI